MHILNNFHENKVHYYVLIKLLIPGGYLVHLTNNETLLLLSLALNYTPS